MKSCHDEHIESIAKTPSIIGLDGIVLATGEVNIFNKNGTVLGAPDGLMFDPSTKILYQLEYKCHDKPSQRDKAVHQLRRNGRILDLMFSYDIVHLYVHDDYEVERID